MEINGTDLEDVAPEELAQMLAEGNPMLVSSGMSRISSMHYFITQVSPFF